MFLFDISNIDNSNTTILKYDYYNTTIHQSEITNAYSDNSYNLQVAFVQSSSNPNFIYPEPTQTYKTSNLRIYSLIHDNISAVTCYPNGQPMKTDILGEMVIEHNQTTGANKLFTCFLLKPTNTEKYNDIDNIINLKNAEQNTLTVNLNNVIPHSKYIIYNSGYNTVIVFTTPIEISVTSKRFLQNYSNNIRNLFLKESDKYTVLSEGNRVEKENFQESMTSGQTFQVGDDAYIQCTPTGESAEQVSTMNVPINSEYVRDAGQLDFMKTTINLCFVIIFLIFIYFTVPVFYKTVVIDSVNKYMKVLDEAMSGYPESNILVRIRSADIMITVFCLAIFMAILRYNPNDFNMVLFALYFAVVFGLGYSTIQFKKLIPSFMKTVTPDGVRGVEYPPDQIDIAKQPKFFKIKDTYELLTKMIDFAIFGNDGYNIIGTLVSFVMTMMILLIFWLFGYMGFGTVWNLLMYITLLLIVPMVPIIGLVLKKDKNNATKNVEKADAGFLGGITKWVGSKIMS